MRNPLSLTLALLLVTSGTAFAAGGGSMPSSPSPMQTREPPTPEERARDLYNAGVRAVENGDAVTALAARQSDPRKAEKTLGKAGKSYESALGKFTKATDLQPRMYEAWNYVGYTQRKLGRYGEALAAYDRALALKPNYAEAIEYRGHAYLGLNRLDDAKDAYLSLYSGNRALASKLLAAMQAWVGTHRGNPAGVDVAQVDAFANWVNERSTIASATAALTREGAHSAW
jgi:tetratricopeptide (TPR) repeat protein